MPLLGIDLGTTFSAVARLDANGTPYTIPNAEGELTTPSVVLFESGGEAVVGREAKRAALSEPTRVAECVKRYIGEPFFPKEFDGKQYSPVMISALILKKLKQDAQKRIGSVDGVVITVPAYFDESRRTATALAGEVAGLKVIDVINEPTSAALAYAYRALLAQRGAAKVSELVSRLDQAPPQTLVVYDLGGGTFDVTLMRIEGRELSVLATGGDVKLGGRDWDERLFDYMADRFRSAYAFDPGADPVGAAQLLATAEDTKKVLTSRKQASYVINYAGQSLRGDITREVFEAISADLLFRTESRLQRVIQQAGLTWPKIDRVLAVGGSTRMPQVLEMLRRVTGKEADCSLSPDEAVAHGAAIYAVAKTLRDESLKEQLLPAQAPKPAPPPPQVPTPAAEERDFVLGQPLQETPPTAQPLTPQTLTPQPPPTPVIIPLQPAAQVPPSASPPPLPVGAPPLQTPPAGAVTHSKTWPYQVPAPSTPASSTPVPATSEWSRGAISIAPAVPAAAPIPATPAKRGAASLLGDLKRSAMDMLGLIRTTDVNAHSLGLVLTRPGQQLVSVLIPQNTPLPCSVTRRFGTIREEQSKVTIHVVEGESINVDECMHVGSCQIHPLPPKLPRGSPVDVTFRYDASGRLHVEAVDISSGAWATISIERRSGVSRSESHSAIQQQVERTTVT